MIQTSFSRRTIKGLQIILTVVTSLVFLNNGCVFAEDKTNKNKNQQNNIKPQIYLVGEQPEKETMNSFSQGMKKVDEEFAPMDEGKILFANGRYQEAKDKYLLSLQIHQKHKSMEWLPRLRLAEVYEKLNDRENAISQLNWLINDCQSEITKKELIERKNKLVS